jgi:hypothetical protein
VSELKNYWGSVVVSCFCENVVAEAGDSSGTQRKGNVRSWKPLPSNGNEEVTVDTVYVTVNCNVQSCAVPMSQIISIINPKPLCSHTPYKCDNIVLVDQCPNWARCERPYCINCKC